MIYGVTSFTASVSALISTPFSVSLSVSVLFRRGIDSMLAPLLLPLLVSASELFADTSRV